MVPEYPPLDEMTLRQLRRVASQYSISRYSRMRKTQLIEAITQAMGVSGNFKSIIKEEKPVEAAKFELGQANPIEDILGSVDDGLGDLPGGYGENRITLLPRDPQWAYAY